MPVYKFGTSHDIPKRFRMHKKNYAFTQDIKPKIVYSQYIDCRYRYEAEGKLKTILDSLRVRLAIEKHHELVIFPREMLGTITTIYDGIYHQFMARNQNINA